MGLFNLNRRNLLKWAGIAPSVQIFGAQVLTAEGALAQSKVFTHGLSLLGDLKYPPDFKHFDYVNPQAPKGGKVRISVVGSFDSLNPFTIKGDAFAAVATETLLTASVDEASSSYGLLAKAVWRADDFSQVIYQINPAARFHDGTPVTAEDVIWSFNAITAGLPTVKQYYANVAKAEATGPLEVTFTFDQKGNRELPAILGQLQILSKAWWTGNNDKGQPRDIKTSSLEAPLGSGPYRITSVRAGETVKTERVKDYWGANIPARVGTENFDAIEYQFFKDAVVAFEAFKADQIDYRLENSSKIWATGYDFPGIKSGRCVQEKIFLEDVEPCQVWVLNLRRDKFKDERVRRAMNFAFDFEWSNNNLFYGQYARGRSIFNNSEFEAKGLPSPEELKLLEPLRAQLPASVFTEEYANPLNDSAQSRRKNLREASRLLDEAGWKITQQGTKSLRKNAKGELLEMEFLLDSPLFERIALPYQEELQKLGITTTLRTIDSAQYERRTESFDYDVISGGWGQSLSPGNEQRYFWGTESADKNGSRNYSGIKNPAIDALIEKVIFAKDRAELTTACRALDRAVMHNNYFVPMWYVDYERVAYWQRFGKPEKPPKYAIGFPDLWWADDSKMPKG